MNRKTTIFDDIDDQKKFLKQTIGIENLKQISIFDLKKRLEKVDFELIKQFISQWISLDLEKKEKNSILSIELLESAKSKGDEFFIQKQFEKASKYYSIIICSQLPLNFIGFEVFKKLQSLSYSNRALCSIQQKQLENAIYDFEKARINYPKEKLSSLLIILASTKIDFAIQQKRKKETTQQQQKIQCLLLDSLKDIEEAKKFCENSIESLKNLQFQFEEQTNRAKNELSSSKKDIKKRQEKSNQMNDDHNKQFKNELLEGEVVLNSITIGFNVEEGRFLEKTMKNDGVDENDNITLKESAYASIVYDPYQNFYCHFCLNHSLSLSACSNGSNRCGSLFCSDDCEKNAWNQFHSIECGLSKLFPTHNEHCSDELRLLIRTLCRAKCLEPLEFQNLIASGSPDSFLNPKTLIDIPGMNGNKWKCDFNSIYSLHSHFDEFKDEEMLSKTISNALIGAFVLEVPVLIVLHLLSILKTNMFAITKTIERQQEKSNKNHLTQEHVRIGGGLFVSASLFNHSCSPNCIVSFQGRELIAK